MQKKAWIFLPIFLISASIALHSQERAQPPSRAMIAFTEIRQRLDAEAKCFYNKKTGYCAIINGRLSLPAAKDAVFNKVSLAKKFLETHRELINLPDVSSFNCSQRSNIYIFCQQYINNTPIYGASITLAVDDLGVVRNIDTTHQSAVPKGASTAARLSKYAALNTAKNDFSDAVEWDAKGLFILPKDNWPVVWVFTG